MVNLDLKADFSEVTNWLGRLPAQVRVRLLAAMANVVSDLANTVQTNAPRGETEKLARSVKGRVVADEKSVAGTVRAGAFYAKFLEGGVNGTFHARAYVRRSPNSIVGVKAYERTVHMQPKPFMQPAFRSMQSRIEQQLADAANRAANDG